MPEVMVDQSQYETAVRARQVLGALVEDPKSGLDMQRRIKEHFPTANTPQLDLIAQATRPVNEKLSALEAQNAALQKMIEDDRLARDTERATSSLQSALDTARTKYGFTDDGMSKVVEIMRSQNLAHAPEAAAALVAAQMPQPKSRYGSPLLAPKIDIYGMQGKEAAPNWAKLHASPWEFLADECVAVHNEFNGLN